MSDIIFKSFYDTRDPLLDDFRKNIYVQDLNLNHNLLSEDKPHKWWIDNYCEDAFKYSNKKWESVKFDIIETGMIDNNVVSMSGAKIYSDIYDNKFLRVNMFYYTLKKFRPTCNGIIYIENGYNDRHIQYAIKNNCSGLFFSIYVYAPKLRALFLNHTKRSISNVKSKLKHLDKIKHVGSSMFNGVNQEFFFYPLKEGITFDPEKIIK